ncbi:putative type VI secretion system effector [Paraburkholderia polaris]|uniref:putative type VI secretion system effector n=1 Tax=Paraburkholderia polaris TaxID=2728848 RepID=UPI0038B376CE
MKAETTSGSTAQLLRGRISNLRQTRRSQDFLFTAADRTKMGAAAITAGVVGLGGIAVGLSGMAIDTTEEADLLEFNLDQKRIRAWVWTSVFKDGDEVEVVAEEADDGWQGYGVRRIDDKIVALYPHCSRGRYAHYKATFAWLIKIFGALYVFMWVLGIVMMALRRDIDYYSFVTYMLMGGLSGLLVFGFIALRISSKMMGFVRLAKAFLMDSAGKTSRALISHRSRRRGRSPATRGRWVCCISAINGY